MSFPITILEWLRFYSNSFSSDFLRGILSSFPTHLHSGKTVSLYWKVQRTAVFLLRNKCCSLSPTHSYVITFPKEKQKEEDAKASKGSFQFSCQSPSRAWCLQSCDCFEKNVTKEKGNPATDECGKPRWRPEASHQFITGTTSSERCHLKPAYK